MNETVTSAVEAKYFPPKHTLPRAHQWVLASLERMAHHYDWMRYGEIRGGVSQIDIPHTAQGKAAILSTLDDLRLRGYVRSKEELWGLAPEYQVWLRAIKESEGK